jgi:site-specific DNA-cytosine methylase
VSETVEILHFHLFAGLGGAARGMNRGEARLGATSATFRCIGGVDVVPAAVRDFERLSGARGTVLDLFDREQYRAFHGHEPPADWREATPEDVRRAAGGERPNIVFTSPPCKGFSGLLSEARSGGDRYQALNRLTLRGILLLTEAWADDPPEFILLENVPRVATRGRALLDQIVALLRASGYSVAETTHDCGELGELAQHRQRFLLVARHREKVPPFLYEPPRRRVRGVGEVLGALPLPEAAAAGPMHRLPRLQWQTWVRLALVEAGGDWRSLEKLRVVDGHLADLAIVPEVDYHAGTYGVAPWEQPSCTVTGRAGVTTGRFAVADPRVPGGAEAWAEGRRGLGVVPWAGPSGTVTSQSRSGQGAFAVADPRTGFRGEYGQYGVMGWGEPSGAIKGDPHPGTGRYAVADPRIPGGWKGKGKGRISGWDEAAGTVIAAAGTFQGACAVADPRLACDVEDREGRRYNNLFRVVRYDEPAGAVTGGAGPSSGAQAIADPRPQLGLRWENPDHYGVVPWQAPTGAVTGAARHDNGAHSVADPRLPASGEQLVAVIRSLDNTWHRPFTTLELAALQGLVDPEEQFELDGTSHSAWRERIGNAVPAPTAAAIAGVMGRALLLAWAGERFALGSTPIWARNLVVATSVETPQ